jgi:hypothetical protein
MTTRSWIRRLFTRTARTNCRHRGRCRPAVEALECRLTPSGGAQTTVKIFSESGAQSLGTPSPSGTHLEPWQIRRAYGFDSVSFDGTVGDGTGQTIAIVDAYDNPSFVSSTDPNFNNSDLHKFDVQFGLPDPPSFKKMNQTGGTTYPPPAPPPSPSQAWGAEIALDVEWAHALAPAANIILVEANDNSRPNLETAAVTFAASQPGVVAVSMSFGEPEFSGESDSFFTTPAGHNGVTFLAGSGDSGAPGFWPAFSNNVVSVGGTFLQVYGGTIVPGKWLSEDGSSTSGGGISTQNARPGYQSAISISPTKRMSPDIALDMIYPVAILDSYDEGAALPWINVGGTSLSCPLAAGMVTIADQGRAIAGRGSLDGPSETLPMLYSIYANPTAYAADFHDITTGNNGFAAGTGYDLVTGIGSPIVNNLVADLYVSALTVVTNTNDSGPGSLRQAVLNENSHTGGLGVTFDSSVFNVPRTITLTSGPINIATGTTIHGPGSNLLKVSGNNASQVFTVDVPSKSGTAVAIVGMDITNGKAAGVDGGAIRDTDEALSLSDVIVENSTSNKSGGGISVEQAAGSLTMSHCIVRNNNTALGSDGGGINFKGTTPLTMDTCIVSGNTAAGDGGGIYFYDFGSLKLTNSTVSDNGSNGSKGGGGVYLFNSSATIINSTIYRNGSSSGGGGIALFGGSNLTLLNSTVILNGSVGNGGGIDVADGTFSAESSIIAYNKHTGSPNVAGAITENFGLIDDTAGATVTGSNNVNGVDPQLGAEAHNGGFTPTFSLQSSSPAIDKGSNPTGAAFDQRGAGYPRTINTVPDIGAFEYIPTTFIVTNTNDAGKGSLREAINETNTVVGTQLIAFDSTVFASAQTIKLTTGALVITDAVIVTGPGSGKVTVDAGGNSGVFVANLSNATVGIFGMTASGGKMNAGGGIYDVGAALILNDVILKNNTGNIVGGGIYTLNSSCSLTMTDCQVINNSAPTGPGTHGYGGGIFVNADSPATLNHCAISSNSADVSGGGVFMNNGGIINMTACTVSGNKAGMSGGGVFVNTGGTLNMTACTVSGNKAGTNQAGAGGGISMGDATATLINCTVSGNAAAPGGGGGLFVTDKSHLTLQNTTVAFNSATLGGGIYNDPSTYSSTVSMESSIVAANSGNSGALGIDVYGVFAENFSLIGDPIGATVTGANNLNDQNPLLGPLADNGGPTLTHALQAGSPAIDKGSNPAGLTTDQRGASRVSGAAADMGAFERQSTLVTNTNDSGAGSLRQAVLNANFETGPDTITFDPAFFATPRTITLTTGELAITDSVTITGPAGGVTVSGNNASRDFDLQIPGNGSVTMSDLSITAGNAGGGAGILTNDDDLTLTRCTVANNTSFTTFQGGGVSSGGAAGTWTFTNSTFSGNTGGRGGALYFYSTGTLNMTGCTVSGNKATNINGGGGLYNYKNTATIINSTFSGNQAVSGSGGAIEIHNAATVTIRNSTVTANTAATAGGGIHLYQAGGTLTLSSTIVAGNTAGVAGTQDLNSSNAVNIGGDNNLIGVMDASNNLTLTGAGNLTGTKAAPLDAKLGPLGYNGGPTQTHAISPASPAYNAGNNVAGLATDQRGFARQVGGGVDIGAYEYAPPVVTTDADSGPGSLRQAILDANTLLGAETITFDPVFFSVPRTITLTSGELAVTDLVTITGPTGGVIVSGNNASRVFDLQIPGTGAVSISDLTITGGKAAGGAGILANDDNLALTRCTISNNTSTDPNLQGGGVSTGVAAGTWTFTDSTFSGNTGALGGAIYFFTTGTLNMAGCTVSGNKATGAHGGGGLYNYSDTATIINSTFSGNQAAAGAGGAIQIYAAATVTVRNSTVTGNTAATGGGIYQIGGALTLSSTIVAGNTASNGAAFADLAMPFATAVAGDNNLVGVMDPTNNVILTGAGNLIGTKAVPLDAKLGPLTNNGGPTLTRALLAGSPAINAGNNLAALTTDQRGIGFTRVSSSQADIGAYEDQHVFVVTNSADGGTGSLRQAIASSNAQPGTDTITFDPVFFSTPQTITLTTGEIAVTDSVTITGPAVGVTVSGNNANRVFELLVPGAGIVMISDLTITSGKAAGGAGILANGDNLTLTRCTVSNNTSTDPTYQGGGVSTHGAAGTWTFTDSTFSGNTGSRGGAIYFYTTGTLSMTGCTVSGNKATGANGGGGLYNFTNTATIINSTFSGNQSAGDGGAIQIFSIGAVTIRNSTITGNSAAGAGGGINQIAGTLTLSSTIVAGNTAGSVAAADLGAPFPVGVGGDNNLIGVMDPANNITLTGAGNLTGTKATPLDAKLGPLANNGGLTLTHALLAGSPAIDKGNNLSGLAFDQRGAAAPRVRGTAADIGAFEAPSNLVVLNANDSGAGSLRQAILDSNSFLGTDTITFDPAFFATPRTITLTNGELAITDSVTITGPAGGVTVGGNAASRVFDLLIPGTGNVMISNLTITGGNAAGGAGILANSDNLTLTRCTVSNNSSSDPTYQGGGVSTKVPTGIWTFTDSTFSGNTGSRGGAIYFYTTGTLNMTGCTVSGNKATGANGGGGLYNFTNTATIINSTFSGNQSAGDGGAIQTFSIGSVTIRNSTITGNSAAGAGGGISQSGGTLVLSSTIVAGNTAGASAPTTDLSSPFSIAAVGDNSLIGVMDPANNVTLTGSNNLTGSVAMPLDAKLGPLANNGGPTLTHALLAGSPAINAGNNLAALGTDQRGVGYVRVVGPAADIGAYEVQPAKISGVVVGDGTAQRSMVTQLKVTLDHHVMFVGAPAAAFTLVRQSDNAAVNLAAAVDDSGATTVVTLTFTGGAVNFKSLADGRYTLTALANQFAGDGLDGNGDGVGGDNYVLVGAPGTAPNLFRLFGDVNGDGTVAASDFIVFRQYFGGYLNAFDFDGDNSVAASDFIQFRLRFGGSI